MDLTFKPNKKTLIPGCTLSYKCKDDSQNVTPRYITQKLMQEVGGEMECLTTRNFNIIST